MAARGPGALKGQELDKLIRVALVAECAHAVSTSPQPLFALAKRYKIDLASSSAPEENAKPDTKAPSGARRNERVTKIEWTNCNPGAYCDRLKGCTNCYAMRLAHRCRRRQTV